MEKSKTTQKLFNLARKPLAQLIINKWKQVNTIYWDSILLKLTTDELLKIDEILNDFIINHQWLNISTVDEDDEESTADDEEKLNQE